jgi:DNA-binding response OmpR family regulator
VAGGSETILLVEDESPLRILAADVLRSRGYAVFEACDGVQALAVAETCGASIHLLVTDVVMPRLSGRELAQELTRRASQVKVLFMSGYTGDDGYPLDLSGTGAHFLQKPFTPEALLCKVREALAKPQGVPTNL